MEYLVLKWLHILSATVMFGTGLGSAFYKFMTDRSGNVAAIAETNKIVVLADWWFTTPSVVLQPVTGILLAQQATYALDSSWLVLAMLLYLLAGLCWLPVVYLQIRMKTLSLEATRNGETLDPGYWKLARIWFWLGVPAFLAVILIYVLMVFKPVLWG